MSVVSESAYLLIEESERLCVGGGSGECYSACPACAYPGRLVPARLVPARLVSTRGGLCSCV